MPPDVRIEHRYPAALRFLREHGPQALAVLHDLLSHAGDHDGVLVARASTREIAERLAPSASTSLPDRHAPDEALSGLHVPTIDGGAGGQ